MNSQVRPVDGFSRLMAQTTRIRAGVCLFGGVVDIAAHFGGETTPSISTNFFHNDRDHKVVIVGGPNTRPANPRWRRSPSWKITKIAISPQRFDRSLRNLVQWCKMGVLTASTVKKFQFPFWRQLNRHISATVWSILMKFGMMTHIGPSVWCKVQICNFRQFYVVENRYLENRETA